MANIHRRSMKKTSIAIEEKHRMVLSDTEEIPHAARTPFDDPARYFF